VEKKKPRNKKGHNKWLEKRGWAGGGEGKDTQQKKLYEPEPQWGGNNVNSKSLAWDGKIPRGKRDEEDV